MAEPVAAARCAQCGEALDGDGFAGDKGKICKWCHSEKQVRAQQSRGPAFTPAANYSPPMNNSGGMSGLTMLRIGIAVVVVLLSFARHC